MGWETSDRRSRLPSDWPKIRLRILRRDSYRCQIREGGGQGAPCLAPANEVDHVIPGDDHSPKNLQAACRSCHARKSSAEGLAARPMRRRKPEAHPGLI